MSGVGLPSSRVAYKPLQLGVNPVGAVATMGPQEVVYFHTTLSQRSPASHSGVVTLSNINTLTDSCKAFIAVQWRVTSTITNVADAHRHRFWAIGPNAYCAPRAMPFHQVCSVMKTTMANSPLTSRPKYQIEQQLRLIPQEIRARWYSGAPAQLDYYPDYQDHQSKGVARSPFQDAGRNTAEVPRRVYMDPQRTPTNKPPSLTFPLGREKTGNTPPDYRVGTATFQTIEPFLSPPWGYPHEQRKSLVGNNTFQFDFQMDTAHLDQAMSYMKFFDEVDAHTTTADRRINMQFDVEVLEVEIYLINYTQNFSIASIPSVMKWSADYTVLNFGVGTVTLATAATPIWGAAGAPAGDPAVLNWNFNPPIGTFVSPILNPSAVPNMLVIYVKDDEPAPHKTVGYAAIDNVSLDFNNVHGQLKEMEPFDLWQMSVSNGLQQSWIEWSSYGGPVFIKPHDIGGIPMIAGGLLETASLKVTVRAHNPNRADNAPNGNQTTSLQIVRPPITYRLYVEEHHLGILTKDSNKFFTQSLGIFTKQDLMMENVLAERGPQVGVSAGSGFGGSLIGGGFGGGFFGSIGRAFKKVGRAAKSVGKYALEHPEHIAAAASMAGLGRLGGGPVYGGGQSSSGGGGGQGGAGGQATGGAMHDVAPDFSRYMQHSSGKKRRRF